MMHRILQQCVTLHILLLSFLLPTVSQVGSSASYGSVPAGSVGHWGSGGGGGGGGGGGVGGGGHHGHTGPCVYEDHLVTDRNWYGYLANITVMSAGRLTFEFYYPADKCCLNILFYSEEQMAIISPRMNCWQKENLVRPEEILRLTPLFSWSGCHMTHPNGVATYFCKGGRSFTVEPPSESPTSWYIAVSNCPLHGLDLRYRLEVFGHVGQCRSPASSVSVYRDTHHHHPTAYPPAPSGHGGGGGGGGAGWGGGGRVSAPVPTPRAVLMARESAALDLWSSAISTDDGTSSEAPCVIQGDINTTAEDWYGFIANISLVAGGGFRYRLTFPLSMQIQKLILYNEDEVMRLSAVKYCMEKEYVIPSQHELDRIIELSVKTSYNGCFMNQSHSGGATGGGGGAGSGRGGGGGNLTCQGAKHFSRPGKIFMALSNCRSSNGLQLRYRFEIFGYSSDSVTCNSGLAAILSGSRIASGSVLFRIIGVFIRTAFLFRLFIAGVVTMVYFAGGPVNRV